MRKGGTTVNPPTESSCCTAKTQAASCFLTVLREDWVRKTGDRLNEINLRMWPETRKSLQMLQGWRGVISSVKTDFSKIVRVLQN